MKRYFLSLVFVVFITAIMISCVKTTFIDMSALFSDNMVLQQNTKVKIWGKTDAYATIYASGSWGSRSKCTADKNGKWFLELPTIVAGGPYTLHVTSGDIIKTFNNVMLGEVWVCSGQSNMEMPLIDNDTYVNNAENEVAEANYTNIRLFTVEKNTSFVPLDTLQSPGWLTCDSTNVKDFSAIAYFFGRELFKQLDVPIGLIHSSWGGTSAEAWTSKNGLLKMDDFAETTQKISRLDIPRDSLQRKFEQDSIQMFAEIKLEDKGFDHGMASYAQPDFDDSDWTILDLPTMWEETPLGNYDGSTWFRKEINISENLANSSLTLCYGAPDDWDQAWVNGVKIGENNVWNELRKYPVPPGLMIPGKNTLTIRIYDYTGRGGFMGEAGDFKLISENNTSISLDKGWLAKKGFDFKDIKTIPISLTDPNVPTVLFNAMINPIIPYSIQGVIWYQGENNVGRATQYQTLFKNMIGDWRAHWNKRDFPFYFVQLASFLARNVEPVEDDWAELREAQSMALELPNTDMAVTIDIGDSIDIHPGNKQDAGKRLALNALAKTYDYDVAYSGPRYKAMEVTDNKIQLSFDYVYNGLRSTDNKTLIGFAIAGADQQFHWAEARISGKIISVWSEEVKHPVAVRYAWSSNPACNLTNSAGLPASPFRTDSW